MMAMVGVINVGGDYSNLDQVKTAAAAKKASFVMNQDRLDNYMNQLQRPGTPECTQTMNLRNVNAAF